jgi:hypothetical protein
MFAMVTHHLKRHKYTIAVGVPVVLLVASSLSLVRSPEEMCLVPEDNRYVEVGETVTLHVMAHTDVPVNAVSGVLAVPGDLVEIESLSVHNSIIDLWTEEPSINDDTEVSFSGGIVNTNGFVGSGVVLSVQVRPTNVGKAEFVWNDVVMLAHDGRGTEVACSRNPIVLSIREAERPTPDVNGDKQVNIFDFGIVSSRLFLEYEAAYDLNMDGRITLADLAIVITNLVDESRLGSIAVLW